MAKAKKKVSKTKASGAPAKKTAKSAMVKSSSPETDSFLGKTLPSFTLDSSSGEQRSAKDLAGKISVLYFYPKDNTPGCTLEGHDFRRLHKEFKKLGAEIYGISRDSVKSHQGFADKCGFPFELLSDPDDQLMRPLKVIGQKSMYGKKFEGIIRSTFLVGADGKIKNVWRNVKVNGHADAVLEAAKSL